MSFEKQHGKIGYPLVNKLHNKLIYMHTDYHICIYEFCKPFIPKQHFIRYFGGKGSEDGKFNFADRIFAYDEKIYVSDYADNSISIFDLKGTFLKKFYYKEIDKYYCHDIMIYILNCQILIYYENLWGEFFKIFDLNGIFLQDCNKHYVTCKIISNLFYKDISDIVEIFIS